MSDIVKNLEEHFEEEKNESEIGYEEIRNLINECKSSKNPLTDLAREIKRIKNEEGYKGTSITYPAPWESLLEEFKDLGERETGFRNLSLMINIAIIEFLLRHKSNPQPKLTDSIGLTLPSTIESNFSEEFKNYLRNLPRDRARDIMLKNAKYLALGVAINEDGKEKKEEVEQAYQQERKELEKWAKKKKKKLKEEAMETLDKAEEEMEAGNKDKAEELIDSVDSLQFEEVRERINEIE